MKLVRDKIPEVIYLNGEIACVHIADDEEYRQLLREKLREEVEEYLESGAAEELADILEVLYSLAAVLGVSESNLEQLRLAKAAARGGFLRRIVWHGSRPRSPEFASPAVAVPPVAPLIVRQAAAQPMDALSLFDVTATIRPAARAHDREGPRRRLLQPVTARGSKPLNDHGKQLQLPVGDLQSVAGVRPEPA